MSVVDLLDQLEGLIANGRRIVFTPTVMVNEDEALDLIDRARMDLPEEIKQAHWTVQEQQKLIGEAEAAARGLVDAARQQADAAVAGARGESERILDEARSRAEQMVSESEIVVAAGARAEALVTQAESEAAEVRQQADTYAREVMARLESYVTRLSESVRKGLRSLTGDTEPARR